MKTDSVQLEILRNRFKAIVEEMATVTLRTAFTVFVKETNDFGACLVAPSGEVLSAPTDTAVSLMVGLPGWEAINAFPSYDEGDVGIANDPDRTKGLSTHLPDVFVWKPIFAEGEIIAFAFNFIHCSDVGGRVPGSVSPVSTDIFQEGIRIPPLKLLRRGEVNAEILDLILTNSRIPDQNWGDMKAQLASLATAERRVKELVVRYGKEVVKNGIADLLDSAAARARSIIGRIPDGTYRASDYLDIEIDGARPIRIDLAMKIEGEEVLLDFTGTDLQVAASFNLPTWGQPGHYMMSFALLNYFRTLDPDIPYNSGLLRPVRMELPQGSIVNPDPGLACGVRAATFIRIMDCIMACLAQAMPDVSPSCSSGIISIVLLAAIDPETGEQRITVAQPLSGGSGARPKQDGVDGTSFTGGWLRNVPNEVLEAEVPVLVEEYGYLQGSAAPGAMRGGAAIHFRLRNLAPGTIMTARGLERFRFRPWGFRGGHAGGLTRVVVNPGSADAKELTQFDFVELDEGDVVDFTTPSGGAYGDPLTRAPEKVLTDVRACHIDADVALRDYGVVLAPDESIDVVATARARAGRRQNRQEEFVYGDERRAYEVLWPEELQRAVIAALMRSPRATRPFLRRILERRVVEESRAGRPPDAAGVAALVEEIQGPKQSRSAIAAG